MKKKSTLERLIEAISGHTGLHMCVYDLDYFTKDDEKFNLPHVLREHRSAFCLKIKSHPTGLERCIKDEYLRAALANRSDKRVCHTCHAGLTDVVSPIRRGGKQIGALYLGQAVTIPAGDQLRRLRRLQKDCGLPLRKLVELLAAQPHLSLSRLKREGNFLDDLRDYIELKESTLGSRGDFTAGPGALVNADVDLGKLPNFFLDQLRPQSAAIGRALTLVRRQFWKKIRLPAVARAAGMSESHFSREFRRELGITFRRCVVEARINATLYLLKRSDLNMSQISELVGYGDQTTLGRAFRTHAGATPRQLLRRQPPPRMLGTPRQRR